MIGGEGGTQLVRRSQREQGSYSERTEIDLRQVGRQRDVIRAVTLETMDRDTQLREASKAVPGSVIELQDAVSLARRQERLDIGLGREDAISQDDSVVRTRRNRRTR